MAERHQVVGCQPNVRESPESYECQDSGDLLISQAVLSSTALPYSTR
ncbi:hypothetical protein ACLUWV_01335 [Bifidobacterium thermophilum]